MRKKIVLICRVILVLILAYTTYHKLIDFRLFRQTLMKSTLIEEYQINFLLFFVPILELLTIFLLLSEKYITGLYMSLFLMLTFTIYLIVLNNFSFYKGCSCGGIFNDMSYFQHIASNISLVIVSITGILLYTEKSTE